MEVDRAGQCLIFRPLLTDEGRIQPRSLFERPEQAEKNYSYLVEALLSLGPDTPDREWKAVAELLGPIIQHDPVKYALANCEATEDIAQWLEARERLAQFWTMTEGMADASRTQPPRLSPQQKREEAGYRLGMDTESMSSFTPDDLERHLEAYMPRNATSPALKLVDTLGEKLNEVFQDVPGEPSHPRIVPLINPETFEVEIVVPQGLQALFLMSCILLHKSSRGFLRRCKRANCAKTVFMSRRQEYCCVPCQAADKTMRARSRKTLKVASP